MSNLQRVWALKLWKSYASSKRVESPCFPVCVCCSTSNLRKWKETFTGTAIKVLLHCSACYKLYAMYLIQSVYMLTSCVLYAWNEETHMPCFCGAKVENNFLIFLSCNTEWVSTAAVWVHVIRNWKIASQLQHPHLFSIPAGVTQAVLSQAEIFWSLISQK